MSVSAETPKPQPGDKVRVSFETTVASGAPNPYVVWVVTPGHESTIDQIVCVPTYAVEVLERADDPSEDEVGTQRDMSELDDATAGVEHAEIGNWAVRWTTDKHSDTPWVWFRWDGPQLLSNATVTGRPVVGALPGTPAAEASAEKDLPPKPAGMSVRVQNEPHGIPNETREKVAALAAKGDRAGAVRELRRGVSMGFREAVAYVEGMSEYRTYLAAHGGTEVDPVEADRMRAMGFDQQPEFKLSDDDRGLIESVLQDRMGEYFRTNGDGYRLNTTDLSGVVADIVFAAIRRDRERGDR